MDIVTKLSVTRTTFINNLIHDYARIYIYIYVIRVVYHVN